MHNRPLANITYSLPLGLPGLVILAAFLFTMSICVCVRVCVRVPDTLYLRYSQARVDDFT